MSKGLKLITALVIVVLIAVVAVVVANRDTKNNSTDSENAESSATITFDGISFSPSEVTVTAGGTVKFVNESDTTIEPASDNHPTHEANSEINMGEIAPGESATTTVDAEGTWEYHDHLNPDNTGTIIVE